MTGLTKRGAVYWFRVRVPSDVVALLGKTEHCRSLKTTDRNVARERISIERLKLETEFADARRKHRAQAPATLVVGLAPHLISPEEIQRIVLCWFHELETRNAEYDRQLMREPSPLAARDKIDDLRVDEAAVSEEIGPSYKNTYGSTWGQKEAEELLARHGIGSEGPHFDLIKELVVRGLVESMRRRQCRLTGNPHPAGDDPYFAGIFADKPLPGDVAQTTPRRMTVAQLAESFVADQKAKGLRQKTLANYQLVAARLAEVVGENTPISALTRSDFVKFRDLLCQVPANATKRFPGLNLQRVASIAAEKGVEPMAARTVNKTLETVSALFNHAVDCDWVQKNHARRLSVKDDRVEMKRSITIGQLQAIFDAPLYAGCKDDENGYAKRGDARPRRGRFWVPLIALYSGMRLNEICQLYLEDVKTADGVHFFDVRTSLDDGTRAGDKRLKTKNARRQVPIHPELRRLGFLDYADGMKSTGQPRLFPELQLSRSGTYSDNFQKFFSRFLRKIRGQNLADISFHWLRHTFRDALREAQIPSEIVNRLCGWEESEGMAAHYGRGPSLGVLHDAISKVNYVGLRLSHLRPPSTVAG